MAVDPGKYDALLAGLTGSGAVMNDLTTKYGQGSIMDVGNDNGRGPGTPGGRGTGLSGMQPSNIGVGGGGYAEQDISAILRGMPPERIAEIQRKMQGIGLLPENYKSFGFVENTMRSGFAELLQVANDRDSNYMTTLDTLLTSGGTSALDEARMDRARKRSALESSFGTRLNTYESSDPASVRQTAEQAFQQALGRKPKPDEMARFTSAFLGRERGAQEAVFDAQDGLEAASRSRALGAFDADAQASMATLGGEGGSEAQVLKQRLQQMIADAPGKITMGKETRSYEEQVRLYNNYKAGKGPLAAKPGTSKHSDARANDLKYENDAVRQWALANAGKYGLAFPIYDPKKKRSMDEAWHVEVAKGGTFTAASTASAPGGVAVAPISQDVNVQRQDAGAQAIEFARNENPVETAAYDIGGQFNSFMAIMNRSVTA